MDRREFLKLSTAGAAYLLQSSCALPGKPLERQDFPLTAPVELAATVERPNVLLILTDQLTNSELGCYGNDLIETPAIDSIANEGILLANYYISGFPCSPSRASILTGLYSHNHGLVKNGIVFDESIPNMGSIFSENGYDTAWIGKWHLGGGMYRQSGEPTIENGHYQLVRVPDPDDFVLEKRQGGTGEDTPMCGFNHWVSGWKDFREYLQTTDVPERFKNNPNVGCHGMAGSGNVLDDEHTFSQLGETHHMANFLAEEAISFLTSAKDSENPFFATLSFYGPHWPVAPPKPWDTMYDIQDIVLPPNHYASMECKPFSQSHNPQFVRPDWTEHQFKGYIRRSYGFVSYLDHQIGRVLQVLRANGQDENTIVIFTSDHGDMLGEHGSRYKIINNGYDTLMKVPCIVRLPGRMAACDVVDSLTSGIDLLPTLISLAGLRSSVETDGIDLAEVINGRGRIDREAIVTDVLNQGLMMRRGNLKYVLNYDDMDECYDLEDDPWEMDNLVCEEGYSRRADEIKRDILDWFYESNHPYADKRVEMATVG